VPAFVPAGSREDEGENFDHGIVGGVHQSGFNVVRPARNRESSDLSFTDNDSAPPHADVVPVPEIPGWPKLVMGVVVWSAALSWVIPSDADPGNPSSTASERV
jgi:hypothetical protein